MSDGPDTKMDVDLDRKRKKEGSSGVSPSLKKQVSLGDLRGACELNWAGSSESNPVLGTVVSAFQDVVVALLFYVHGKHLRSCRDGQLT